MRFSKGSSLSAILLIIMAFFTVCAVSDKKNTEDKYARLFSQNNRTLMPACPDKATFAGEKVPLDLFYVKEALEREIITNTFMQSSTLLMFKRANRWFPVIEPILKANGIPDDFKFLAVAESNLANVVSSQKAEGFWQFIERTGKEYGLEINEYVDERYHPEKATQAACDFLNAAHLKFGSWSLAAAAYNRGVEGLDRAVKNQKATSYFDLYLNDETSRYVYRIIALKEIYQHPARYGYFLLEKDFYPSLMMNPVQVDSSIVNLPLFAISKSINYRIFRELNPWIRNYSLPNPSGKRYTLNLPSDPFVNTSGLEKKPAEKSVFFHDTLNINDLH